MKVLLLLTASIISYQVFANDSKESKYYSKEYKREIAKQKEAKKSKKAKDDGAHDRFLKQMEVEDKQMRRRGI